MDKKRRHSTISHSKLKKMVKFTFIGSCYAKAIRKYEKLLNPILYAAGWYRPILLAVVMAEGGRGGGKNVAHFHDCWMLSTAKEREREERALKGNLSLSKVEKEFLRYGEKRRGEFLFREPSLLLANDGQ